LKEALVEHNLEVFFMEDVDLSDFVFLLALLQIAFFLKTSGFSKLS
jgi:hypothetical protein